MFLLFIFIMYLDHGIHFGEWTLYGKGWERHILSSLANQCSQLVSLRFSESQISMIEIEEDALDTLFFICMHTDKPYMYSYTLSYSFLEIAMAVLVIKLCTCVISF